MYYDIKKEQISTIVERKIKGSFTYMSIALLITLFTSVLLIKSSEFRAFSYSLLPFALAVQIIVPLTMSIFMYKAKPINLMIGMFIYSITTGILLSTIAEIYTLESILNVLIGTVVLFIVLAVYGYTTRSNLLKYGNLLMVGLISIILSSIVNIFLKSSSIEFGLSILGVIIFVIYVSYDTQRIKYTIISLADQGQLDLLDRVEIIAAFSLYLDFINLFIYLIRIFGKRKD